MNVILVIVDSLRKDHVSAYGNDWIQTPSLNALAKESLRFTQAHPDAMPTIPARRAIHTGMRTFPVKAPAWGWRPIPAGRRRSLRYSRIRATGPSSSPTLVTSGNLL